MIIWVDAQLSPAIANWITDEFGVTAVAKLLITIDKFARKSRLTDTFTLNFKNLTIIQSLMTVTLIQQRFQAHFATKFSTLSTQEPSYQGVLDIAFNPF